MKKENLCTKCQSTTMTKRAKTNLTIDESTKEFIPVSARIQVCTSCGNKEYSENEKARLRELISFYKKEAEMKENGELGQVEEEEKKSVSA